MFGWKHFVVIFLGMIGLLLGGVLIDLDHYNPNGKNSWKCKWYGFIGTVGNYKECEIMSRSRLHNPIVMLSSAIFFMMLGIGILIHYIMDYVIIDT